MRPVENCIATSDVGVNQSTKSEACASPLAHLEVELSLAPKGRNKLAQGKRSTALGKSTYPDQALKGRNKRWWPRVPPFQGLPACGSLSQGGAAFGLGCHVCAPFEAPNGRGYRPTAYAVRLANGIRLTLRRNRA